MNKQKLRNKKRALLLLSAFLLSTNNVQAFSLFKDKSGEEIESSINDLMDPFVKFGQKEDEFVDNIINSDIVSNIIDTAKDGLNTADEIKDDMIDYQNETLDIVTTIPNENPLEQREYYFINSLIPAIRTTKYYDENWQEVKKKSENKRYKVKSKIHHTITENEEGSKLFFEEKTYEDLLTNETWTNTVQLDENNYYIDDSSIEFGLFKDIEDVLPEDLVKEEYSLRLIKDYTTKINDLNTDLNFTK